MRNATLYNGSNYQPNNAVFLVTKGPKGVLIRNMDILEDIPIYVEVFPNNCSLPTWAPLLRCGTPVVISGTNTELFLKTPGRYHLGDPDSSLESLGGPTGVVTMSYESEEDVSDVECLAPYVVDTAESTVVYQFFDPALVTDNGSKIAYVPLEQDVYSDGSRSEFYYIHPLTGDKIMNTNNVGANPATPALNLLQLQGEMTVPNHAAGADSAKTASDILGEAIAAGLMLSGYKSDGTLVTRAATAADFIASADVDLKPVNGHSGVLGAELVSTTSNASVTIGTNVTNIDPGGSRTAGELTQVGDFIVPTNFNATGVVTTADGSITEVMIRVASAPVDETTL